MQAAALCAFGLLLPWTARGQSCWHGEFDEQRCCVKNDPACWDDLYTRGKCCMGNETRRSRGDPTCWMDGYSYEECCKENPKDGCWDANFGPERCCVDKELNVTDLTVNVLEIDFAEAFGRILAHLNDDSDCEGEEFWNDVKKTGAALNVSHTFGQVGRPPNDVILKLVSKRALRWAQEPQTWHADAAQCPEGALAAVDLVISDIDRDVSEDTARTLAGLRHALAQRRPFASMQPWRTQDLMVEHVPRLYGLEGHHRCHGSSLRIYMYQLPQYAYMLKPVLRCSQKMSQCSASVHLHRWLMSGSCRTESPEEADLFYFPAYEACYNETACSSGDTERCFPQSFDPEELPFFHRRGGQDHIFVFACNLLPFMDLISIRTRNSIMVTVESFQAVNVAGPNMLAWLVYSKDVLIPGYIPAWRVSSMVAFCRPMIERTILATFHGHSRSSEKVGHMYKRSLMSEVRDRIISYFGQNSCCSAGPPVRDYFRRSGLSRFCLIPAGLTAWTIHLYEAFFFGCVPVILSDDLTVPFQDVIDWTKVSIKVPTNLTMEELHQKLLSVRFGTLKRMHQALKDARCWFDYSRGWGIEGQHENDCSPYNGLMRGLAKRAAAIKTSAHALPKYWEPSTG
ncbi:unnamed protein product [Durusdinium trenchii]|uniref:Exostosin GT47 domain-containing protein n=1 Tax=Durusdinium trenchii TaxID=1381693 RepID=A0ABP0IZX3_9DINO